MVKVEDAIVTEFGAPSSNDGFMGIDDGSGHIDNIADNGVWDFIDCGVDNDGVAICETDSNWNDGFGNGICDYDCGEDLNWDGVCDDIFNNFSYPPFS